MITKRTQHNEHPVRINYYHKNAHGQPALYCVKCDKWIQWLSKQDIKLLKEVTNEG